MRLVRSARALSFPRFFRERRTAALLSRWVAAGLCLLPGWVWACPSCTAKAPESPGRSTLLLGAMMVVPFLVVAVGAWAAWRAARGDAARDP